MKVVILLSMLFMHLLHGFILEHSNILKKELRVINKNNILKKTKRNYAVGHVTKKLLKSLTWTICVILPIVFATKFKCSLLFHVIFVISVICHYTINYAVVNKNKFNKLQLQILNVMHIIVIFLMTITV